MSVDLTNCDREPIHVPGAIQPHGVLLAFDRELRLVVRSANAWSVLGANVPTLGEQLQATHFGSNVVAAVETTFADGRPHQPIAVEIDGVCFDVIAHGSGALVIVELERRPDDAPPLESFAAQAQRAITRCQAERDLGRLLAVATEELRRLTGFDRVMTYCFQHDDSGLVSAESKVDELEPFLGLRYPATDIPAQARRLYTINSLRLIEDIGYRPVPLEPPLVETTGAPLDLSHSVLRSVSPIHVEYLQNMGVEASMSVSIVVHGKLWGLFACHHRTPRRVPPAVRMACDLLSQVVAVLVERAQTAEAAATLERSLAVQTALLQRAVVEPTLVQALLGSPGIAELLECDGVAVALGPDVATRGNVPSEAAIRALVAGLDEAAVDLYATNDIAAAFPGVGDASPCCGVLVIRFFREHGGYVAWFRREEVETVRWGGNPEKRYEEGPLGPRLTPRGSFEEWREQVRGKSRPFTESEKAVAGRLRRELQALSLSQARSRIVALERSNEELDRLAYVASHDLRAPLRAIASLSEFVEEDLAAGKFDEARANLELLRARTVKLDALLRAILEYSKAGRAVGKPQAIALAPLVDETIELLGPPAGITIERRVAVTTVVADPTFLQQVLLNLITNALRYGVTGAVGRIEIGAVDRGGVVELWVRDFGPGLAPQHHARVFELFSRVEESASGSGIGLAGVRRRVEALGGRAWVESSLGNGATFRFTLPNAAPQSER